MNLYLCLKKRLILDGGFETILKVKKNTRTFRQLLQHTI